MTHPEDEPQGQPPLDSPADPSEPPDDEAPASSHAGSDATGSEEPRGRRRRARRPRPAPTAAEPGWDQDAAPVVTDEGVYGTLSARPAVQRLRDFDRRRERAPREQWTRTAAVVLALAAGLWLVLFSAAQVTGASVAVPAIERTVEAMTGLRPLLALHEDDIRASTADPVPVPGFEVDGVSLSRADVQSGGVDAWHDALLTATAEAIYRDGPEVLSGGEPLTGEGIFSTPGGARLLMRTLSEGNHNRAATLLWPVGLVALAAAVAVLALGTPFGRFSTLGFALLVAAVPSLLVGALGVGLVAFVGSDGSALAQETNAMAGDLARAPVRNGVTVLVLAVAITILGRIAGAVFSRSESSAGQREEQYDPAYD